MRGKNWAWWVNLGWFSMLSIGEIVSAKLSIPSLVIFVYLILLLLGHKNFFKIAS